MFFDPIFVYLTITFSFIATVIFVNLLNDKKGIKCKE